MTIETYEELVTAFRGGVEPVKVGQVRQSERGPAHVDTRYRGEFFSLRTSSGELTHAECAIERMTLLCPAPEDLRAGDVFDGSGWRVILKAKKDGFWVGEDMAAPVDPTELTLKARYRIIVRGPEKSERYAVGVGMARPGGDLSAVSVVALGPDGTMRIVRTSGLPKADPAPFLPGAWACMARDANVADRERDAYHVESVEHTSAEGWRVNTRLEGRFALCVFIPRMLVPAPPAVRGHAIRWWNRATIEAAREAPPRAVTSFGQRKGEAWQRYQRQLAGLLERASGAEPWLIGSGHVADLLREAS